MTLDEALREALGQPETDDLTWSILWAEIEARERP